MKLEVRNISINVKGKNNKKIDTLQQDLIYYNVEQTFNEKSEFSVEDYF